LSIPELSEPRETHARQPQRSLPEPPRDRLVPRRLRNRHKDWISLQSKHPIRRTIASLSGIHRRCTQRRQRSMSCILRHQGSHNLLDGSKPLRLGTWPAFLEIRERVPWMSRVTYSPDSRRFGHSGIHSLTTAVKPLKPPFVTNTLTTASPCVGRPLTVTAPMPGEPPVTSATVRTNFSVMFILIYLHNHLLLPGGFAPFCVPCVAMLRLVSGVKN